MITKIKEAKRLIKHISCDCKCKINNISCNSNQKRNNDKCQCQFKCITRAKKYFTWSPNKRVCENRRYLKKYCWRFINVAE